MATFSDLQTKARKLSDVVAKTVANKAPYKTGRLKKALLKANTFDSLIELKKGTSRSIPVKSIELNIDYAPTDAEYGMYWNSPTISYQVKNATTKNKNRINFVDAAIADPQVQKAFDEIADVVAEMIATSIASEMDTQ
jgi:hypothetical protein